MLWVAVTLPVILSCQAPIKDVSRLQHHQAPPILAFGDSLTAGIGGSGTSYPRVLEGLLHRTVINVGVPGDTTASAQPRWMATLHQTRPDVVLLCLGVNDFVRGVPPDRMRAELSGMLQAASDDPNTAGIRIIVLSVPAPGAMAPHPLYAGLTREHANAEISHAMSDALLNPLLKADPVHLNRAGYEQVAQLLQQQLRRKKNAPGKYPAH
ncbi:MAG: arylesterase [Salinisphaeraceae bacterium]|nr:arylesterase [Salinisphaeraceae bacterium]